MVFYSLDVTSEESMTALGTFVEKEFGHLDILVNNAALGGGDNSLRIATQDFRKVFETNFYGPFLLSQLMILLLKKSASGRIINISSGMEALHDMGGGDAAYRVSKTTLNSITAVMAADFSGIEW